MSSLSPFQQSVSSWVDATLADCCTFHNGLWKGKKGPFESATVIRNTNFTADGEIDLTDVAVLEVEVKQLAKRRLQKGDIIIEKSGGGPKQPVGRVVLFEAENGVFSFSNFTSVIRVTDKNRLDPQFLHRLLYWWYIDGRTEALQRRSTGIRNLDFKTYQEQKIPLPPLEEQKRIVAVLDKAFAALDRARTLAEANLADAEALFAAKLRAIFIRDALNWERCLLPELCTHFGRGKSRHRPRNDPALYGGDIPFIQTGDISEADHFLTEFRQTYSTEGLKQSKLWPKGTICIAIVGATIGETAILDFDACFPDSVIGLRPDTSKLHPEFVEFMLQAFKDDLKEAGKGSARDNINLGTFERQEFPVPELAVQTKAVEQIEETRRTAGSLRAIYSKKLQDLADLRQSLLQKAFAGELT